MNLNGNNNFLSHSAKSDKNGCENKQSCDDDQAKGISCFSCNTDFCNQYSLQVVSIINRVEVDENGTVHQTTSQHVSTDHKPPIQGADSSNFQPIAQPSIPSFGFPQFFPMFPNFGSTFGFGQNYAPFQPFQGWSPPYAPFTFPNFFSNQPSSSPVEPNKNPFNTFPFYPGFNGYAPNAPIQPVQFPANTEKLTPPLEAESPITEKPLEFPSSTVSSNKIKPPVSPATSVIENKGPTLQDTIVEFVNNNNNADEPQTRKPDLTTTIITPHIGTGSVTVQDTLVTTDNPKLTQSVSELIQKPNDNKQKPSISDLILGLGSVPTVKDHDKESTLNRVEEIIETSTGLNIIQTEKISDSKSTERPIRPPFLPGLPNADEKKPDTKNPLPINKDFLNIFNENTTKDVAPDSNTESASQSDNNRISPTTRASVNKQDIEDDQAINSRAAIDETIDPTLLTDIRSDLDEEGNVKFPVVQEVKSKNENKGITFETSTGISDLIDGPIFSKIRIVSKE